MQMLVFSLCSPSEKRLSFQRPLFSRINEEKMGELRGRFNQEFALADRAEKILLYGVLPLAVTCSAYYMKDRIYKTGLGIGTTVIGTGQWLWSGCKGLAHVAYGSSGSHNVVDQALATELVQDAVAVVAQDSVPINLTAADILYIKKLRQSFFERVNLWVCSRASLVTGLTGVMVQVLGKRYLSARLAALLSTQDIEYFIAGSTQLLAITQDFKDREKMLNSPLGTAAIKHSRERIFELTARLYDDVMRTIAFMQAVNNYNNLGILSVDTQTQMLIDAADDMILHIEYKLDEFDHTTDLAICQELLKDVVCMALTYIELFNTEVHSFIILATHQK